MIPAPGRGGSAPRIAPPPGDQARYPEPTLRFSREFLQDLGSRLSIVEVVGRHVRLTKAGSSHRGLCPFHQEKTPSFHVRDERGSFHCFGCGEGGDAIRFVMHIEGLSFVDSVAELAKRAGLPLPEEDLSPRERAESAHRDAILQANEAAARYFADVLEGDAVPAAREELEKREVPESLVQRYRLGAAPEGWDGLRTALRRAGVDEEHAIEAGLLIRNDAGRVYDRFRGRLMFPIHSPQGKVIAFGGRTLVGDDAKYINSPESPVYSKSGALYGLWEGRQSIQKADRAVIVEGYFDVLGMAKANLGFAVAPCGTALTDRQLSAVRRHTRNVTLLFDADAAGRKAAFRALDLCLDQQLWPSFAVVPDGKDPDDFVRTQGADAMRAVLAAEQPVVDVFLDSTAPKPGDPRASAEKWLDDVAPMLARLGPVPRERYMRRVAGTLGVDPRVVDERVRVLGHRRASGAGRPEEVQELQGPPRPPVPKSTPPQREIVKLLVQDLAHVAPLVEELGLATWIRHAEVEGLIGAMLAAWRAGRTPHATELLTDLQDEELRRELSGWLADEERWYPPDVLESATQEALIRLRIEWLERRRADVQREITRSEAGGSTPQDQLLQLLSESIELQREREGWESHFRRGSV